MYRSEEAWLFIIKLEVCVSYVFRTFDWNS